MTSMPFTVFDLVVGLVLLVSVVAAASRGFVRELLSLASWAAALLAAYYLYAPVRPLVLEAVRNDLVADLATAVGVFLAPFVLLKLLTGGIARRVAESGFAGVDRLLAILYGAGRGAFLVCAAYLAALVMLDQAPMPFWVVRAVSRPYVEEGARVLARLLPEGLLEGTAAVPQPAGSPMAPPGSGYREDANRALEQLIRRVE